MQITFTDTEAVAICEMMAKLADEGYSMSFSIYSNDWRVYIKEPKYGNIIADGYGFYLVDALNEAWQKVPESEVNNGI